MKVVVLCLDVVIVVDVVVVVVVINVGPRNLTFKFGQNWVNDRLNIVVVFYVVDVVVVFFVDVVVIN